MIESKIKEEIIKKAFLRYKRKNILAIVLFGSQARGNARNDSDYDVNVFIKKPIKKFSDQIMEVQYKDKEIFVGFIDTEHFKFLYTKGHPHLYCTFRDGLALYDSNGWFNAAKTKVLKIKPSKEIALTYITSCIDTISFIKKFNFFDYEESKKAANLLGFGIMMFYKKYPLSPHTLKQELKQLNKNYEKLSFCIEYLQNRYYNKTVSRNYKTKKYKESLAYLSSFAINFLRNHKNDRDVAEQLKSIEMIKKLKLN